MKLLSKSAAKYYAIGGAIGIAVFSIATFSLLMPIYNCASQPASGAVCNNLDSVQVTTRLLGIGTLLSLLVCIGGCVLIVRHSTKRHS